MYIDNSSNKEFPKTLLIHNHLGGCVWQSYHVVEYLEAELISETATKNGFMHITLVDGIDSYRETFPEWRSSHAWWDRYKSTQRKEYFKEPLDIYGLVKIGWTNLGRDEDGRLIGNHPTHGNGVSVIESINNNDKSKYSSDSHSIGFIEGLFLCTKSVTESHAERYLELIKKLDIKGDEDVKNYILGVYPKLV